MGNGFDFAEKNAVCTETRYSYSYNAVKGACKDSSLHRGRSPKRVSRVARDASTDNEKTLMSTVAVSIIAAGTKKTLL